MNNKPPNLNLQNFNALTAQNPKLIINLKQPSQISALNPLLQNNSLKLPQNIFTESTRSIGNKQNFNVSSEISRLKNPNVLTIQTPESIISSNPLQNTRSMVLNPLTSSSQNTNAGMINLPNRLGIEQNTNAGMINLPNRLGIEQNSNVSPQISKLGNSNALTMQTSKSIISSNPLQNTRSIVLNPLTSSSQNTNAGMINLPNRLGIEQNTNAGMINLPNRLGIEQNSNVSPQISKGNSNALTMQTSKSIISSNPLQNNRSMVLNPLTSSSQNINVGMINLPNRLGIEQNSNVSSQISKGNPNALTMQTSKSIISSNPLQNTRSMVLNPLTSSSQNTNLEIEQNTNAGILAAKKRNIEQVSENYSNVVTKKIMPNYSENKIIPVENAVKSANEEISNVNNFALVKYTKNSNVDIVSNEITIDVTKINEENNIIGVSSLNDLYINHRKKLLKNENINNSLESNKFNQLTKTKIKINEKQFTDTQINEIIKENVICMNCGHITFDTYNEWINYMGDFVVNNYNNQEFLNLLLCLLQLIDAYYVLNSAKYKTFGNDYLIPGIISSSLYSRITIAHVHYTNNDIISNPNLTNTDIISYQNLYNVLITLTNYFEEKKNNSVIVNSIYEILLNNQFFNIPDKNEYDDMKGNNYKNEKYDQSVKFIKNKIKILHDLIGDGTTDSNSILVMVSQHLLEFYNMFDFDINHQLKLKSLIYHPLWRGRMLYGKNYINTIGNKKYAICGRCKTYLFINQYLNDKPLSLAQIIPSSNIYTKFEYFKNPITELSKEIHPSQIFDIYANNCKVSLNNNYLYNVDLVSFFILNDSQYYKLPCYSKHLPSFEDTEYFGHDGILRDNEAYCLILGKNYKVKVLGTGPNLSLTRKNIYKPMLRVRLLDAVLQIKIVNSHGYFSDEKINTFSIHTDLVKNIIFNQNEIDFINDNYKIRGLELKDIIPTERIDKNITNFSLNTFVTIKLDNFITEDNNLVNNQYTNTQLIKQISYLSAKIIIDNPLDETLTFLIDNNLNMKSLEYWIRTVPMILQYQSLQQDENHTEEDLQNILQYVPNNELYAMWYDIYISNFKPLYASTITVNINQQARKDIPDNHVQTLIGPEQEIMQGSNEHYIDLIEIEEY